MGLREVKVRSVQYANRLAERMHFSKQSKLISDRELEQKLNFRGSGCEIDLLEHFRNRNAFPFYPSFDRPKKTIETLRRFRNEEGGTVAAADEIYEGQFRFFGRDTMNFGGRVPDWHLEPISGKRSPMVHWTEIDELSPELTGDKKIIWELNRHQYFSTLGQAYWLTGDEMYVEKFVGLIEGWMESNPPKMGVNWMSSLELAFRSISWIWAMHFFKESPNFKSDLLRRVLKYLYLHGLHIETHLSTYSSPNTHLTGEALGLYHLGTFFPRLEDARRWKKLGYRILMDALDFQVRPDGTYCEQSSHYLRYTIDFYCSLLTLLRLERTNVDPKLLTKLNKLFDFLLHIVEPNGNSPNLGDDDGGRLYQLDKTSVTDLRPVFALGAVLLERRDLKFIAGSAGPEILWLLGTDGIEKFNRIEPLEPPRHTACFQDGGFYTSRSDWTKNANTLLISCGPFGFLNGGHAHAHTLSFLLTVDGNPVFVDSGTYTYTSDPASRDYFRSSAAHNCLTVNDHSSSTIAGSFSWKFNASGHLLEWREMSESVFFRGTHDGFEQFGVTYERQIIFDNNGALEVTEHVESRQWNRFKLHFVLSPHLSAEILDGESSVVLEDRHGKKLTITTSILGDAAVSPAWTIDDCFVSPIYGARLRSKKLTYEFAGSGAFEVRNTVARIKI
jgi:hypothetical protein